MAKIKNKKSNYCYLDPDFPNKAYAVILFLSSDELGSTILPLEFIYEDTEDINHSIQTAASEINEAGSKFNIIDTAVIIPIVYQSKYPLKKEHWNNNIPKYSMDSRFKAFIPLLERHYLYKLLITPGYYDKKENHWYLNCTYPFNFLAPDSEIEEFILNSDQPVDMSAKYAAIYSLDTPLKYNWQTGKTTQIDFDLPKNPKIVS